MKKLTFPFYAIVVTTFLYLAGLDTTSSAQTFTKLADFGTSGPPNCGGSGPLGRLVQGADGILYGTTFAGGCGTHGDGLPGFSPFGGTVFKFDLHAGTLTTLYSFCSLPNCADGGFPLGDIVLDADGNLYGVNIFGPFPTKAPLCSEGLLLDCAVGTVFKMNPRTQGLNTLHTFCSQVDPTSGFCLDGQVPLGGLIKTKDGNIYGVTWTGGGFPNNSIGTVFKIGPDGSFSTLSSLLADVGPSGRLVEGPDGSLYGTSSGAPGLSAGSIFKSDPTSGAETSLYHFCSLPNCQDGAGSDRNTSALLPGLVLSRNGNLYGTTPQGGLWGHGTIFKFDPTTAVLNPLLQFCAPPPPGPGAAPLCNHQFSGPSPEMPVMMEATDGNLYGVTNAGGTNGFGVIFQVNSTTGVLTTMHSFCSQVDLTTGFCVDGGRPISALSQGADGNLYGTADGGANNAGIIFKLTLPSLPDDDKDDDKGDCSKHLAQHQEVHGVHVEDCPSN